METLSDINAAVELINRKRNECYRKMANMTDRYIHNFNTEEEIEKIKETKEYKNLALRANFLVSKIRELEKMQSDVINNKFGIEV